MRLDETLTGLMVSPPTEERARELAQLGFIHWLGSLPGDAAYEACAVQAFLKAMDFRDTDPAVDAFCDLLRDSLKPGIRSLDLKVPEPKRRGGARTRRLTL